MVKLKNLIKDIDGLEVKGSKEIEISGLSSHSKKVAPGDLFFAKKGYLSDGADYIKDAFLAGAKAVVTDLYNPFFKTITQIVTKDVKTLEGILAKKFYQNPSKDLFLVGITGTNGKTSIAYLIQHLFSSKQLGCGMIGTIEVNTGKSRFQAALTTPEIISINRYLKEMVNFGYHCCAMEVSSHALDQNRVAQIEFDHVIFTNLTQDHLDYHKDMDSYKNAKKNLFNVEPTSKLKTATVNIDCPYAFDMMQGLPTKTVSMIDPRADFFVSSYRLFPTFTEIEVVFKDKKMSFTYPLIGRYNIYNVVSAVSCAIHKGLSILEIEKRLKSFPGVPGRLQQVKGAKFPIYIDFAHTEDALKQVLTTLKELKFKKLILVFGCGGDRDQSKREKMGQVAAILADHSIITSDNPRSEDPLTIAQMVESGMNKQASYEIILDRKEAIEKAILLAEETDCVVITGKGHEAYQIFQNKSVEFSDYETALRFINR
jgi:UDP-N-acetylmuramoyl-L-alanyl-D-glutamate--2,6-diaminopimelate ligase